MARASIWREMGRCSRGIPLTLRLVGKNPGKKPTLRISTYANKFHS